MGEIELNKEEQVVTIYSDFFLYGDLATDILAKEFTQEIETLWNEPEGIIELDETKYVVQFKMKGLYSPKLSVEDVLSNTNPKNNYYRVEDYSPLNISWVDGIGSNTGYMFIENLYSGSTTGAHEYGHSLGLEHPENLVIIGQGRPGIMYPRGTLVDAEYQYDPHIKPGEKGGTIHPMYRRVLQQDIDNLNLPKLIKKNQNYIGQFTSQFHPKHRKPEHV
ncbi:MAG: peptidase M10 [Chitinophagales bacterium]|jgi:hypothetical protein|nr:hypothetical protein [Sphingobacteriales bacterium]